MPKKPKFTSDAKQFGDDIPRRRIVVSTHLTKAENDAMVAKAQAARVTQKEYLKRRLNAGVQDGIGSNNQLNGDAS